MTGGTAHDRSRKPDELTGPAARDLERRSERSSRAEYPAQGRGTVRSAVLELQRSAGNRAVEHIAGTSLDSGVRADMEERLGADLDHVRIHADERAAARAREGNAAAFTQGADITFSEGMY